MTCEPATGPRGAEWPHGAASGASVTAPVPVVPLSWLSKARKDRLAGDPGSSSRLSSVCKECLVFSFSCVESRGGWQPSPAAQWHWVWGGQSWSSGLLSRCESGKPSKCGDAGGGGQDRGSDHWLRRPCGGSQRPGPHHGSHLLSPGNLWYRQGVTPSYPQGSSWEHVSNNVRRVSVGPLDQVGGSGQADARSGVGD